MSAQVTNSPQKAPSAVSAMTIDQAKEELNREGGLCDKICKHDPSLKVKVIGSGAQVLGPQYSEATRAIQTALQAQGKYKGEIDGKFGEQTKEAVKAFQKEQGIKIDGIVGEKTLQALRGNPKDLALPATPAPTPPTPEAPITPESAPVQAPPATPVEVQAPQPIPPVSEAPSIIPPTVEVQPPVTVTPSAPEASAVAAPEPVVAPQTKSATPVADTLSIPDAATARDALPGLFSALDRVYMQESQMAALGLKNTTGQTIYDDTQKLSKDLRQAALDPKTGQEIFVDFGQKYPQLTAALDRNNPAMIDMAKILGTLTDTKDEADRSNKIMMLADALANYKK